MVVSCHLFRSLGSMLWEVLILSVCDMSLLASLPLLFLSCSTFDFSSIVSNSFNEDSLSGCFRDLDVRFLPPHPQHIKFLSRIPRDTESLASLACVLSSPASLKLHAMPNRCPSCMARNVHGTCRP